METGNEAMIECMISLCSHSSSEHDLLGSLPVLDSHLHKVFCISSLAAEIKLKRLPKRASYRLVGLLRCIPCE